MPLLKSVVIEDGVTSIGYDAFYGCSIKELIIAEGSKTVTSTMVICKDTLGRITIPVSVISIGDWAFEQCGELQNVYYGGSRYSPSSSTSIQQRQKINEFAFPSLFFLFVNSCV